MLSDILATIWGYRSPPPTPTHPLSLARIGREWESDVQYGPGAERTRLGPTPRSPWYVPTGGVRTTSPTRMMCSGASR